MATGRERTGARRPAPAVIVRDPASLGGTPVFRGTRVPVAALQRLHTSPIVRSPSAAPQPRHRGVLCKPKTLPD
jgi:Protein of unknown function (DUF433)